MLRVATPAFDVRVRPHIGLFQAKWTSNTREPLVHASYATPTPLLIPMPPHLHGLRISWTIRPRGCVVSLRGFDPEPRPEFGKMLCGFGKSMPPSLPHAASFYMGIVFPSALPHIAVGPRLAVERPSREQ